MRYSTIQRIADSTEIQKFLQTTFNQSIKRQAKFRDENTQRTIFSNLSCLHRMQRARSLASMPVFEMSIARSAALTCISFESVAAKVTTATRIASCAFQPHEIMPAKH